MEKLPKEFAGTLEAVDKWHKQWFIEMFGAECGPDRYYNTYSDGRYLSGVKEGEAINDEKEQQERVLELLCRLRLINLKLNGVGLNTHLKPQEREQLRNERERVYNEYCILIEPEGLKRLNEAKIKPTEQLFNSNGAMIQDGGDKATEDNFGKNNEGVELPPELDTPEAKKVFEKAIEKGYIAKTSTGFKWIYGGQNRWKVRLAYFVYKLYSPKGEKIPQKPLCNLFGVNRLSDSYTQYLSSKRIKYYNDKPFWAKEIDRLFEW